MKMGVCFYFEFATSVETYRLLFFYITFKMDVDFLLEEA